MERGYRIPISEMRSSSAAGTFDPECDFKDLEPAGKTVWTIFRECLPTMQYVTN
jgi:hypothetical protein